MKYGEGLDLADQGDLAAAQSKLGEVVRESPDFTRAQEKYTELIKRLRAAQKQRGVETNASQKLLLEHIAAHPTDFGYMHARCNLALVHLRALVGAQAQDAVVWVPPSKRAAVDALVKEWLDGAEQLIAANREYRKHALCANKRAELSDEDAALEKR